MLKRSDPKLVFMTHHVTLQKAIKQPYINARGILCWPCIVLLVIVYVCGYFIYLLKGLTCICVKFYSHQLMQFFIQLCISVLSYIKIT